MTNENKKLNFASIAYHVDGARKSGKESIANEVVRFGDYNDFPDYLVNLFNNSSTHETCVNAIVEGIKGDGLTAEPTFVLDVANRSGESWNDVYSKVAKDYYLFGGFSLEVIYNKARTKVSEVYHVPFASVRAKEANHRGICEGYYIASDRDWETTK